MTTSKGFSLIEVLVALLLTTVGVLGMVALQGRGIQYTQDSLQRNTAVELSNDLIEIIRANPRELFKNATPKSPMNTGMKDSSLFYKSEDHDFADREDCVASSSRVASTPQEQRDCWAAKVEAALPGGGELFDSDTYVCRSPSPGVCNAEAGSMLEIRLAWRVREGACMDATDSTVCTYTVRVEP